MVHAGEDIYMRESGCIEGYRIETLPLSFFSASSRHHRDFRIDRVSLPSSLLSFLQRDERYAQTDFFHAFLSLH
jgi:hypothetical protein